MDSHSQANLDSPYHSTLDRAAQNPYPEPFHPHLESAGPSASYSPLFAEHLVADNPAESSITVPGPSTKNKKRKSDAIDGKIKKTRQTQSCDACRARKVKCDRPPPAALTDPNLPTKDTCSHCSHLGLTCSSSLPSSPRHGDSINADSPGTFDYQPKKRGPPNQYVKKLGQTDSAPGPDIREGGSSGSREASTPWRAPSIFEIDSNAATWSGEQAIRRSPGQLPAPRNEHSIPPFSTLESAFPDWRDPPTPHDLLAPAASRNTGDSIPRTHLFSSILAPPPETADLFHPPPVLVPPPTTARPQSSPPKPPFTESPLSHTSPFPVYPHNPSNPLDAVLPRGLLYHIVDLYFDYIYGLCPYIHRPSFMRDLREGREERPNADEFIALVMGLVSATLTQIPRSFVPLPRKEVKGLIIKAHDVTKRYLFGPCDEPTVTRHILIYMIGITGYHLGYKGSATESFGHNWSLLVRTRANEESSYANYNPVEREIRRRVLWLCIGGDITTSVLSACSPMASESLYADVDLPGLVEDDFISENGYREMPSDRTSILSGFYYISKLFRLTAQALDKRNHDRRRPPSGLMLQMRVNEVNELYDQVIGLMDDCPSELRLDHGADTPSVSAFSDNWDVNASEQVRAFLLDPKASRSAIKDAFLVQQANIYVTQQMTRYILLQYRDDLLELQQGELVSQNQNQAAVRTGRLTSAQRRLESTRAMISDEEKESVASDLLSILQKIPIQVIAVNGVSLVMKIRLVASTLLDALNTTSASQDDTSGSGAGEMSIKSKRAQSYLWDFLRILSEIEALYSLDDDDEVVRA